MLTEEKTLTQCLLSNEKGTEAKAAFILKALGVNPGKVGYRYLVEAITLSIEKPEYLELITKLLYPAIANVHKKTWQQIERGIRQSIAIMEDLWYVDARSMSELSKQVRADVFPCGAEVHYCNKEFISIIADYIYCH